MLDAVRKPTTLIISTPHVDKGDEEISFFTDSWNGRMKLQDKIDELLTGKKRLCLNRGRRSFMIQGYEAKSHTWITGLSAQDADSLPFMEGDKLTRVVPQAGG